MSVQSVQPSKEFRALCHEHHVEMTLNQVVSHGESDVVQTLTYACTVPDCLVHYNVSRGYFPRQNGSGNEWDQMPKVNCFLDGAPMYLAQIDREKRAFRLWRCPQCGASLTNEEGLVGLAPTTIQQAGRSPKLRESSARKTLE
jgi:hypothetical protein